MRGLLAEHLTDFIFTINQLIAQAKEQGIVPTPDMARAKLSALDAYVSHSPAIDFVEDKVLTTDTCKVPVRIYSPSPDQALPVLIYFHGGGHMCGDVNLYDPMCRKMAIASHCIVISVEYRLAPENPYPCGLNDAEAVLRNYQQLLAGICFNSTVSIGGDSAGGAICSSLVMKQVNDPTLLIDKQILIYPSVDYTMSEASIVDNGEGFFLEKARIQWYFDHYFLNNEDRKSVSPLHNPVNADSPETLLIIAGCDPLRDEGLAYAKKLSQAGVLVSLEVFDNMIHAFMNIEDLVPKECQQLYSAIGNFINQ